MHYRALERSKVEALQVSPAFDSFLELNSEALAEVKWGADNVRDKNGTFSAYCVEESLSSEGRWSSHESMNHINVLEFLAIFFALKSLVSKRELYM